MKNLRNNKGFTLIELMIVVVIIGILAALAIPRFSNTARSARQSEASGPLAQLCTLYEASKEHPTPAASLTDLQNFGWDDPSKDADGKAGEVGYFTYTFDFTAPGTATATPNAGNGLKVATMNCLTRKVELGAVVE